MTPEQIEQFEKCQSDAEWSANCDAIKAANDGRYPDDWWQVMKLSGRMDRILARWGADSKLRITTADGTKVID